ncbi:head GIN domain-containing protein [Pseudotenacibaculum sp. MALMAid0570]|mgnify:CR=1 FL=1|uniref:head GIN domain-containing protein n=1 Tax=Pseudotenacibaculum sp. MALMAid0570 TaxID=3143938 RepID=UPI0032DF77FE
MKKLLFLVAFITSNVMISQTTITKQLGDFEKIKIYNGINVELIKSDEQKIEITGEKAEKVKVKNSNNTLKVTLKFPDLSADGKVNVKLYYNKDIKVIDGNEGATITGKDIDQLQLEVKSQERAFINLVIKTKHLKVKSSSGGIIKLTGSSKNQDIDVDLYGIYHGYGLSVSDNTSIRAGSGAKAEVSAGETLNAKVSFGGSIFYKGNPEVIKDKKVAGGIIKQVD